MLWQIYKEPYIRKVYVFAFIRDPMCACFNENKIITSYEKGRKNSILQKLVINCTEKIQFLV